MQFLGWNTRCTQCNMTGDMLAQASVLRRRRSCRVGRMHFPAPSDRRSACYSRYYKGKNMPNPSIACLKERLDGLLSDSYKAATHVTSLNIPC
ncbi:hypothetical protein AVEN_222063-1 [Araneus ventricosus]|uniref:Uncharacterized protein n=1 Tax=Araneus ventricosus TaxID=182803 RepID=A0A4Y2VGK4_ARAVE|nr:hypothetical protein AVEN_16546-1 [Araneus ventricosus]GBO24423.1 hypothetical protein AVEN_189302-1 [Araneus ventricosus]GBO24428.1 hypothetical protein AVEN_219285-1 [Araneus ventricosus]GBO24429.1 hypothetical protein AVEN_222063-1 [Araneus ventricosus]